LFECEFVLLADKVEPALVQNFIEVEAATPVLIVLVLVAEERDVVQSGWLHHHDLSNARKNAFWRQSQEFRAGEFARLGKAVQDDELVLYAVQLHLVLRPLHVMQHEDGVHDCVHNPHRPLIATELLDHLFQVDRALEALLVVEGVILFVNAEHLHLVFSHILRDPLGLLDLLGKFCLCHLISISI